MAKSKEEKQALKDLKTKITVIGERVELLRQLDKEIKETKAVSTVKLGGMVDDLTYLNPFTQEKLVPFLLDLYEQEQKGFEEILISMN